jgi:hypothetical protein
LGDATQAVQQPVDQLVRMQKVVDAWQVQVCIEFLTLVLKELQIYAYFT